MQFYRLQWKFKFKVHRLNSSEDKELNSSIYEIDYFKKN